MKNVKSNPSWTPHRLAALQLAWTVELGSKTLNRIRESALDFAVFLADPKLNLPELQQKGLQKAQGLEGMALAHQLEEHGIQFVLFEDADFPAALRKQPDPPFAIFVRGAALTDGMRVAVVGTRRMTEYGRRAAELVVGELARHGAHIVSGLAMGVDAIAHIACMDAGGVTVAVLPGGIDERSIAPPRHRQLAKRILETGGTLISEYPPAAPVQPFSFLHRNRHIAALSDAIVVVEGDHDSGALVTARLALESGRDVLAVPGPIFSAASRGTNDLIRQGARPCTSADDVFTALGLHNAKRAKQITAARATIPVSPAEARALEALDAPHTVDELARILNEPIAATNATVSLLELKGRIISIGPRTFVRAPS